jgi:hypothetical protein
VPLMRCPYCRRLFNPNPRTKDRQKVCSRAECQKKRKRDSQKKWCKKNPTYFQGHYPRVKKWRDAHPGYLKNYRRNNPTQSGAHKKEDSGQNEISSFEVRAHLEARIVEMEQFFRTLPCSDIQDVIEAKNPDLKPCCTRFTPG